MTIDELIRELGHEVGLPGLALDENSVCGITFDDIALTIESTPDRVRTVLYAPLGPALLAMDCRNLLLSALSANYFGQKTGGAVLALDEMKGDLVLWRDIVPEGYRTTSEFIRDMELFIETARTWQERIRTAARITEPATSPAPAAASRTPLPGQFA
mgnify:CR=1 FL=1